MRLTLHSCETQIQQAKFQCLASPTYLSCTAFWAVEFGSAKAGAAFCRFTRSRGVLQDASAAGPRMAGDRSLTMTAVLSQVMIPPEFPAKVTPLKSTLELTSARRAGPLLCATVPLRINASEFPSMRIAALVESALLPLFKSKSGQV